MDFSNLIYNNVTFKHSRNNWYLSYNKKKFILSLTQLKTITTLQEEGKTKFSLVFRINKDQKEFFDNLQKHIIKTLQINEEDFIPIIKKDFLKVKIEYRGKFLTEIKQDGELFSIYELEKGLITKSQIHLKNIWNFNGKYGMIIVLKKLTII